MNHIIRNFLFLLLIGLSIASKDHCLSDHNDCSCKDGRDGRDGRNGRDGQPCRIYSINETCYSFVCPSESPVIICQNNCDTCLNGTSCNVTQTRDGALLECQDGTSALVKDGTSCNVTQLDDGALILCQDGTSAVVNDGIDGINGTNGESCSLVFIDSECFNLTCPGIFLI